MLEPKARPAAALNMGSTRHRDEGRQVPPVILERIRTSLAGHLWGLLLVDPFVELRLLAATAGNSRGLSLGKVPATHYFDRLAEWNSILAADDELRRDIAATTLSELIPEACDTVKRSKLLAYGGTGEDELAWRVAAARAVLATAFFLAQERDQPSRPHGC
jgi:hypothetical protein